MNDTSENKMETGNTSILAADRNASSDFVKIAALRKKIEELLSLEELLRQNAADRILAVMENNIRIGWALMDIKHEIRGDFTVYVENNLPFTDRWARKLMQAAKLFQRDEKECDWWNKQITVAFYQQVPVGRPLIDQIIALRSQPSGPRHFQDLLVTSGLAPTKQIADPSERESPTGFFKLLRAVDACVARLVRYQRESSIENWSLDDRKIIRRKLQPLKDFWESQFE